MRLGERLQVLARLQRGDREQVGRSQVGGGAVRDEHGLDARVSDADALRPDTEELTDLAPGERRVDEEDVAGAGGVRVLAPVHRLRALRRPFREADGHEVVDRRGAYAGALRRVHPVGEVEHVEGTEEALGGGTAGDAPRRPDGVGRGQGPQPQLHVEAGQRGADALRPAQARGRERHDLVAPRGLLQQPCERAADVVAHAGGRVREGADVEGDPHGVPRS